MEWQEQIRALIGDLFATGKGEEERTGRRDDGVGEVRGVL